MLDLGQSSLIGCLVGGNALCLGGGLDSVDESGYSLGVDSIAVVAFENNGRLGGVGTGFGLVDGRLGGDSLRCHVGVGISGGDLGLHGVESGLKSGDLVDRSFVGSLIVGHTLGFGVFGCLIAGGLIGDGCDQGFDSGFVYGIAVVAFVLDGGFGCLGVCFGLVESGLGGGYLLVDVGVGIVFGCGGLGGVERSLKSGDLVENGIMGGLVGGYAGFLGVGSGLLLGSFVTDSLDESLDSGGVDSIAVVAFVGNSGAGSVSLGLCLVEGCLCGGNLSVDCGIGIRGCRCLLHFVKFVGEALNLGQRSLIGGLVGGLAGSLVLESLLGGLGVGHELLDRAADSSGRIGNYSGIFGRQRAVGGSLAGGRLDSLDGGGYVGTGEIVFHVGGLGGDSGQSCGEVGAQTGDYGLGVREIASAVDNLDLKTLAVDRNGVGGTAVGRHCRSYDVADCDLALIVIVSFGNTDIEDENRAFARIGDLDAAHVADNEIHRAVGAYGLAQACAEREAVAELDVGVDDIEALGHSKPELHSAESEVIVHAYLDGEGGTGRNDSLGLRGRENIFGLLAESDIDALPDRGVDLLLIGVAHLDLRQAEADNLVLEHSVFDLDLQGQDSAGIAGERLALHREDDHADPLKHNLLTVAQTVGALGLADKLKLGRQIYSELHRVYVDIVVHEHRNIDRRLIDNIERLDIDPVGGPGGETRHGGHKQSCELHSFYFAD